MNFQISEFYRFLVGSMNLGDYFGKLLKDPTRSVYLIFSVFKTGFFINVLPKSAKPIAIIQTVFAVLDATES